MPKTIDIYYYLLYNYIKVYRALVCMRPKGVAKSSKKKRRREKGKIVAILKYAHIILINLVLFYFGFPHSQAWGKLPLMKTSFQVSGFFYYFFLLLNDFTLEILISLVCCMQVARRFAKKVKDNK